MLRPCQALLALGDRGRQAVLPATSEVPRCKNGSQFYIAIVSIGTSELVTQAVLQGYRNLAGVRDDVMIGEDIASVGINNEAGARAQPLLLLRQVEIATEEGIVVKRIGFGGSARPHCNVDDRRRDVLQDISERGLSAGRHRRLRPRRGKRRRNQYEDGVRRIRQHIRRTRGHFWGRTVPPSVHGRGLGKAPRSHDFGSCQTSTSSTNAAPIQAQCISYFASLSNAHAPWGRGPIIAVRSPCRLPASAGAVHPSSASRRPWPRW